MDWGKDQDFADGAETLPQKALFLPPKHMDPQLAWTRKCFSSRLDLLLISLHPLKTWMERWWGHSHSSGHGGTLPMTCGDMVIVSAMGGICRGCGGCWV